MRVTIEQAIEFLSKLPSDARLVAFEAETGMIVTDHADGRFWQSNTPATFNVNGVDYAFSGGTLSFEPAAPASSPSSSQPA